MHHIKKQKLICSCSSRWPWPWLWLWQRLYGTSCLVGYDHLSAVSAFCDCRAGVLLFLCALEMDMQSHWSLLTMTFAVDWALNNNYLSIYPAYKGWNFLWITRSDANQWYHIVYVFLISKHFFFYTSTNDDLHCRVHTTMRRFNENDVLEFGWLTS